MCILYRNPRKLDINSTRFWSVFTIKFTNGLYEKFYWTLYEMMCPCHLSVKVCVSGRIRISKCINSRCVQINYKITRSQCFNKMPFWLPVLCVTRIRIDARTVKYLFSLINTHTHTHMFS